MRVTTVKAARKDQKGLCIRCRKPIVEGEGYRWAKGRYTSKKVIHSTCGSFKQSELTSNDKLSQLYAAIENVDEWIESAQKDVDPLTLLEDAKSALEECADAIEEVVQMYRDSAEAIEDGFGHETYQSEEMNSNADELESFASDVRDSVDDVDEFDEAALVDEFNESIVDDDEYAVDEFDSIEEQAAHIADKQEEFVGLKRDEWADEVFSAMSDAVAASPL